MEETKKKLKSLEISVKINKEKLSFGLILKMLLAVIALFNMGLALVAVGANIVFGYTLVHSVTQWIGYNFLALGVKWIYGILFKERVTLVIPEDTKAQINKEFETETDTPSKKQKNKKEQKD